MQKWGVGFVNPSYQNVPMHWHYLFTCGTVSLYYVLEQCQWECGEVSTTWASRCPGREAATPPEIPRSSEGQSFKSHKKRDWMGFFTTGTKSRQTTTLHHCSETSRRSVTVPVPAQLPLSGVRVTSVGWISKLQERWRGHWSLNWSLLQLDDAYRSLMYYSPYFCPC